MHVLTHFTECFLCPPRTSDSPSAYCFSATRLRSRENMRRARFVIVLVIRELLLMHTTRWRWRSSHLGSLYGKPWRSLATIQY